MGMRTKRQQALAERENNAWNAVADLPVTATDLEIVLALTEHKIARAMERGQGKRLRYFENDSHGRMIGIKVDAANEAPARDWCVKALLAGYTVFAGMGGDSLASTRKRMSWQSPAAAPAPMSGPYL
jgi:hypothetical protein